jgi:putative membrane protein
VRTRRSSPRDVGEEPDPRFTLANERTFLAWTRTALALLAAGLAVVELLESEPRGERLVIGVPLMLLAALVAYTSYGRWAAIERAMRLGEPLPYSPVFRLFGVGIGTIAVVAVVLVLVRT